MTSTYYIIAFDFDGVHYDGRVTPEKKAHGTTYHVVLNEVFFGYLHKDKNHWQVSEQRPDGLVQETGKQIEASPHQVHVVE
jgi:hypothetical protein